MKKYYKLTAIIEIEVDENKFDIVEENYFKNSIKINTNTDFVVRDKFVNEVLQEEAK